MGFKNWLERILVETTGLFDGDANDKFTAFTTKLDQAGLEFKKLLSQEIIFIDEQR